MKKCDFCGTELKMNNFVRGSITRSGVESTICFDCVDMAATLIDSNRDNISLESIEKKHQELTEQQNRVLTPKEIVEALNKVVVNQDKAKKMLAINVYNHYSKLSLKKDNPDFKFTKSNMIMFGESGSGKTLMLTEIAKLLHKPMVIIDVTTLTETGYIGLDVSTIFKDLYIAAGKSLEKMKDGIIVFDEIDKLAHKVNSKGTSSPVQQELLTMLEGRKVLFSKSGGNNSMSKEEEMLEIDTSNILFIGIGAFTTMLEGDKSKKVGFMKEEKKTLTIDKKFTQDDFINYGFMREFAARFSIFEKLNSLTKEDLIDILMLKNSLLEEYQKLFELENIVLEFDDSFIQFVVDEAIESKKGARGLKFILDSNMLNIHFDYIGNKKHITLKIFSEKGKINTKEISCKKQVKEMNH